MESWRNGDLSRGSGHVIVTVAAAAKRGLDEPLYFHIFGNMEKHIAITGLAALAQETRLDIHRLLVETGPEGLPAGRIAERLGLPANFATMTGLVAFLTENYCRGDSARCGIAAAPPPETMTEGASRHEAPARPRRR
jgi:ArsR family transcriptional regulator, arsenate/arsenite/antimonite-responsive transcriptional repressor